MKQTTSRWIIGTTMFLIILIAGILVSCSGNSPEQAVATPAATDNVVQPTETVADLPQPTATPTVPPSLVPTATPDVEPTRIAEETLDQLRDGAVAYLPDLFGIEIPPEEGGGTESWYTSMDHFVVRIVVTGTVNCEAYEVRYYVAQVPPAADDGRLENTEFIGLNGTDPEDPDSQVTTFPGGGLVARWRATGAMPERDELYLVGLDGQVLAGEEALDEVMIQGVYRYHALYEDFLFSPSLESTDLPSDCEPAAWVNPEAIILDGAWLEGSSLRSNP